MPTVSLTKDKMEAAFLEYLEDIFSKREVISADVKGVVITRETAEDVRRQAFEAGFHDAYSDTDISIKVLLPRDGSVTPHEYLKRIDRFGVSEDSALGWMFVPVNNVCRVIFKNGMRYDLIFDFEYGESDFVMPEQDSLEEENPDWPVDNINRFWFIEIQALGKLYRKDHLISAHLANMNCNDTLVMQMILRDKEYGTSHHRYGHSEDLEYTGDMGKMPYRTGDPAVDMIADHLYAAALSYDRLVKKFYPGYRDRSEDLFSVWDCYERIKQQ